MFELWFYNYGTCPCLSLECQLTTSSTRPMTCALIHMFVTYKTSSWHPPIFIKHSKKTNLITLSLAQLNSQYTTCNLTHQITYIFKVAILINTHLVPHLWKIVSKTLSKNFWSLHFLHYIQLNKVKRTKHDTQIAKQWSFWPFLFYAHLHQLLSTL
jgi:hypothetical protein